MKILIQLLMLLLYAPVIFSQNVFDMFSLNYVCFLDLDYDKINRDQPLQSTRVIYPCFVKDSTGWRIFKNEDYNAVVYQKRYRLFYEGEYYHSAWAKYRYDTTGKKVMDLSQDRIPKAGKPSANWHTFQNIVSHPPMIALNRLPYRQYYKLSRQQPGPYINAWIEGWLEERSIALNLGKLPYFSSPFVDTVKNFWLISDDTYLVQADINLQMFCFTDSIKFKDADKHPWTIEQRSGEVRSANDDILDSSKRENFTITDEQGRQIIPYDANTYYVDEKGSFHKKWKTPGCYFLKAGDKFMYVGRNLQFMGIIDMDDDGSVEVLFRRQAHGFISYIMVCNNFNTILERKVIEWW